MPKRLRRLAPCVGRGFVTSSFKRPSDCQVKSRNELAIAGQMRMTISHKSQVIETERKAQPTQL
jgi:hypothetical protein